MILSIGDVIELDLETGTSEHEITEYYNKVITLTSKGGVSSYWNVPVIQELLDQGKLRRLKNNECLVFPKIILKK